MRQHLGCEREQNRTESSFKAEAKQSVIQEQNYVIEQLHFFFSDKELGNAGEPGKGTPPMKITWDCRVKSPGVPPCQAEIGTLL